jgi:uncharacterized OB-fold protein
VTISDAELLDRFPRYRVDHDNKAFYRGWLDRRLLINRCADCGTWHHPPRPLCPACWSTSLVPTEVSGRGTVHLLVRLHQGPPVPDVDYAAGPYPVAAVDLEEQPGLRFTSTVVECPPDELRIGLPVELTWRERDGVPFPVFRPRGEGA